MSASAIDALIDMECGRTTALSAMPPDNRIQTNVEIHYMKEYVREFP